ncbi:hypothetical protein P154DRAFT_624114 [Amniculicola lignicola CBS 123094]|uniref:N-acetyltransferase domain-containing protein n=1 Tax=Amniculicola lignicola CBS 123094 TaxID=1392246 RepID=A0A6A5W826_9PLEO|nr:hypothetical protein P154DRAFT_624114 [Amniculicola lignicola CBS 123094]
MGSITPTPQYTLHKLDHSDPAYASVIFPSIINVILAANHTPYDPLIQLFIPTSPLSPNSRQAALNSATQRFLHNHHTNPVSTWYFVAENPTSSPSRVVGCCEWEDHDRNPFEKGVPKLAAEWWPEGEAREFCERFLEQVYTPRASWMTRPHRALNWMAVHPSHRRCGIASMLMTAGLGDPIKDDKEAWMEASPMGKPLYEKFGFKALLKIDFDMTKTDPSNVWRKMQHEMTPGPIYLMWRPKRGAWDIKPWAMVPVGPSALENTVSMIEQHIRMEKPESSI